MINSERYLSEKKIELFELVNKSFGYLDLKDTYVLGAQHILPTTIDLINTFISQGLSKNNLSFIGKCYSTNPLVYNELKRVLNFDICPSSIKFSPSLSFDEVYKKNVKDFFEHRIDKILSSNCKQLIVIDDGGELILAIHSHLNKFSSNNVKIVGVEQTSSGFRKLSQHRIKIPVVNVARCKAKLEIESILIAEDVYKSLDRHLSFLTLQPQKALILGRGAIGKKLEAKLANFFDVASFDSSGTGSITHLSHSMINSFDLIIGCSGQISLDMSLLDYPSKTRVLASASSSDREFNSFKARNMSNSFMYSCHSNVLLNGNILLNGGFPINFSSQYNDVDGEKYYLTRALLLAGAFQAHLEKRSGLIDFSETIETSICELFIQQHPQYLESISLIQTSLQ
jgi:hypothetical protein